MITPAAALGGTMLLSALLSGVAKFREWNNEKKASSLQSAIQNSPSPTPTPAQIPTEQKTNTPIATSILGDSTNATPSPANEAAKARIIAGFIRDNVGEEYLQMILNASNERGIEPALLAAQLFQESGIDPNVPDVNGVTKEGKPFRARGMGQIVDIYHPEVTDEQAKDPNFAINWTADRIKEDLGYFDNDYNRALAAHFVGRGGASIKGPAPYGGGPQGQDYIDRLSKNVEPDVLKKYGIKTSYEY